MGLRRRPEDIAGWPEINRILTPLALDAEAQELYARSEVIHDLRWSAIQMAQIEGR